MADFVIGKDVPWNAMWSGEECHEIRPCRHANGKLAVWSPHKPGVGRPLFAKPHHVRQRKSISQKICTVCGTPTPMDDQWWFPLGSWRDGLWMTTEAPVHQVCADHALKICPMLKKLGLEPVPFPSGAMVAAAQVGGAEMIKDFGLDVRRRTVIGHLKFAWRECPVSFPISEGAPQ